MGISALREVVLDLGVGARRLLRLSPVISSGVAAWGRSGGGSDLASKLAVQMSTSQDSDIGPLCIPDGPGVQVTEGPHDLRRTQNEFSTDEKC